MRWLWLLDSRGINSFFVCRRRWVRWTLMEPSWSYCHEKPRLTTLIKTGTCQRITTGLMRCHSNNTKKQLAHDGKSKLILTFFKLPLAESDACQTRTVLTFQRLAPHSIILDIAYSLSDRTDKTETSSDKLSAGLHKRHARGSRNSIKCACILIGHSVHRGARNSLRSFPRNLFSSLSVL